MFRKLKEFRADRPPRYIQRPRNFWTIVLWFLWVVYFSLRGARLNEKFFEFLSYTALVSMAITLVPFALWSISEIPRIWRKECLKNQICWKCGYSVRDLPSNVCPECGFDRIAEGVEAAKECYGVLWIGWLFRRILKNRVCL